jgi:hypothetical protein
VDQQPLPAGPLQLRQDRGFFAVFQHLQHALVVVVHDHGDVLLALFF